MQLFANNVTVYINQSISSVDTTILLDDVSKLPVITGSNYFLLTFFVNNSGVESNWEIVKVTAVTGNACTVVRGFDGTNAREWAVGSVGQMRINKSSMDTVTANSANAIVAANEALASVDERVKTSDLALNTGASLVGFVQDGLDAVGRTVKDELQDRVSVKQFGAIGDGVTDDTAAMQAAHNTGRVVYYPAGIYKYLRLTIPYGGICGESTSTTFLSTTDTTSADTITLTASNNIPDPGAYLFRDFSLLCNFSKTAGAGIAITPISGENQGSYFENVLVYHFPTGIKFNAASNYTLIGCKLIENLDVGVYVQNTNNADSGDSSIDNCDFISTSSNAIGVFQSSSGGLKVCNSKFNGGRYGYFLGLDSTESTSNLLMSNVSIENMTVAAIQLSRMSGSASFSHVCLSNMQIAICKNGIQVDASGFMSKLTITGGSISLTSGVGTSAIGLGSVADFNIGGMSIIGNGGSPTGISIAAACTKGKVGNIAYTSMFVNANNSSTTTYIELDRQFGTASTYVNIPYGALYAANTPITFPVPFTSLPFVTASILDASTGGVSAIPYNITSSGFTMGVTGANTGVTVQTRWHADGVL